MQISAHMIVEGLVQGVGFRYYVHRHATSLGLSGFAANLFDGSVEIEVVGNRSAVEELIKLVKIGPRSAQVTNLTIEWKEFQSQYSHFDIR
jgi:acylphosphatase